MRYSLPGDSLLPGTGSDPGPWSRAGPGGRGSLPGPWLPAHTGVQLQTCFKESWLYVLFYVLSHIGFLGTNRHVALWLYAGVYKVPNRMQGILKLLCPIPHDLLTREGCQNKTNLKKLLLYMFQSKITNNIWYRHSQVLCIACTL